MQRTDLDGGAAGRGISRKGRKEGGGEWPLVVRLVGCDLHYSLVQ